MSDFDVSMRLHRPDDRMPPEDRKPFEWTKVTTALQICGAVLAIPAGAAGVYAAYRSNFSTEVTCQTLRTTIIATLEKNVDLDTRRALARRDVEQFERTCAEIDPDAKRVFAIMMAPKGEPAAKNASATAPTTVSAPAIVPLAAPEAAKPAMKANAAPRDPITEAIEREAAAVRASQAKAPASVAAPAQANIAPLPAPPARHNAAAPVPAVKPAEKPVERAATATAPAPKADKPALGEPPAPLGSRLPAEANAQPAGQPAPHSVTHPISAASASQSPVVTPVVTPMAVPRTAALPSSESLPAPDPTSAGPMGGPIPPASPPPLETANVPALPAPYSPPVATARSEPEPAKKSGVIPFVTDLFGSAPPRPPGEISREAAPENGPAN